VFTALYELNIYIRALFTLVLVTKCFPIQSLKLAVYFRCIYPAILPQNGEGGSDCTAIHLRSPGYPLHHLISSRYFVQFTINSKMCIIRRMMSDRHVKLPAVFIPSPVLAANTPTANS